MTWMRKLSLHRASGTSNLWANSLVRAAGICFALISLALFEAAGAQEVTLDSVAGWSSAVSENTHEIAWGDVNGDGYLDLAVGNDGGTRVYINHSGILEQTASWSSQNANNTLSVAWGDVNGDGYLDLAVGSYEGPARIFINHEGVLEQTASWSSMEVGTTTSVAWGDVNRDGHLDLAVGSYDEPTRVFVNLGGILEQTASWNSQEVDGTTSVAWGDVNRDGNLDLAVGNWWAPTRVYTNHEGVLEQTASWISPEVTWASSVAWGDVNGDGHLDLAVGSLDEPTRVFINHEGVLEQTVSWSSQKVTWAQSVAWGDVDGDGALDLAVGNYGQPTRIYNNHAGILGEAASWSSQDEDGASRVAWGDVNRDGYLDLAVGSYQQPTKVYVNNGGILEQTPSWSSRETNLQSSMAWGDVNGDGYLDLAVGNYQQPTRVYINHGGILEQTASWSSQEVDWVWSVAWGDVDGDGDLDLAVGSNVEPTRIYVNHGGILEQTASWSSQEVNNAFSVAWGDVNSDGSLDLAVGNFPGPTKVYINHGGTLEQTASWGSQIAGAVSVAWGDVNGDGYLDLGVGDGSNPTKVYFNRGGILEQTSSWSSQDASSASCVAWGDVNGDGYLDLAVGNSSELTKVYINRHGILERTASWSSPKADYASSVAWGDVDGDGHLDLAAGISGEPTRVYLNKKQESCAQVAVLPNSPTCFTQAKIVPSDAGEGHYHMSFGLVDRESDPVSLTVEYSELGGGRWEKATVIEDVSRLVSYPEGVSHEVTWDASGDGVDGDNVWLRLSAFSNPDRAGLILWPASVYQLPVGRIDGKPRISLLYPSSNTLVADSLPLYGRIWDPTNFAAFRILLSRLPDTSSWTELKQSSTPVAKVGEISSLDLRGFPSGDYVLRVEAADARQHRRVLDRPIKLATRAPTTPRALRWFPSRDAKNVQRKSPVAVVFDRPMNQSALTSGIFELSRATGLVEGNVLYDASSRALVFDPAGLLDSSAFHYFVVSGSFPAQSGDRLAGDIVSSFGTGGGIPTDDISSIVPRRGTTGWPLGDSLAVTYARPSEFRYVTVFGLDGDTVLSDTLVTGSNVTSTVAVPRLRPKMVYLVRISDDPVFNSSDDFLSYFITEDADLPLVTGVSPAIASWLVALDAVVTVSFSKGINTFSADSTSLYLLGPTGRISGLITFGTLAGGTTATFSPSQPLDPGTSYTVVLTSRIQDNIGNAIDSTSWTFTTGYFKTMLPAGGEFVAGDLSVYFAPGSFSRDTEVKAGRMPATAVSPPDSSTDFLGVAYDLLAESQPQKPVEIRLSLPATNLTATDVPVLYRWDGSTWEYVGGTYDQQAERLGAVVPELGRLGAFAVKQAPEHVKLAALSGITLTPRAFSPAGSLFRGEVAISFALAAPGRVTVKVYNLAGRLERVLVSDEWMASGTNAVTWSGQDYRGDIVPSGLYIVTVEAAGRTEKKTVAVVNQ